VGTTKKVEKLSSYFIQIIQIGNGILLPRRRFFERRALRGAGTSQRPTGASFAIARHNFPDEASIC